MYMLISLTIICFIGLIITYNQILLVVLLLPLLLLLLIIIILLLLLLTVVGLFVCLFVCYTGQDIGKCPL